MMRINRMLLAVVLTTALVFGAVESAGTPRKPAAARKPAGAVNFPGTIAAPPEAAEVTWGKGALILSNGSQHAFEVMGRGRARNLAAYIFGMSYSSRTVTIFPAANFQSSIAVMTSPLSSKSQEPAAPS
jgi:hypothetical protein